MAPVMAALVACGGDDGAGDGRDAGGGASVDGGRDDASPPDSGAPPDAALADGSPDAADIRTVTVTFTSPDGPVQGADVVFLDADDGVIAIEVTDADGEARAVFPTTGKVVIHRRVGRGDSHEVTAWLSVPPGSTILFGRHAGPGDASATLTVDGPALAGATFYQVVTPCGTAESTGGVPTVTVALASCTAATHLVWSAVKVDPTTGQRDTLATALEPEADIAAGTYTMTAPYVSLVPVTVEVAGIPAVDRAHVQYSLHTVHGLVMEGSPEQGQPVGGSLKVVGNFLDLAGVPAVSGQFDVTLDRLGIGFIDVLARADHVPAPILDVGGDLIPTILAPAFDPAARRFTWLEDGGGDASAVVATLELDTSATISWLAVGPHQSQELVLPLLPPPLGFLNPTPGSVIGDRKVTLYQHPGGYDPFRAELAAATSADGIAAGERLLVSRHGPIPLPP